MKTVYSRQERYSGYKRVLVLAGSCTVVLFLVVPFANLLSDWNVNATALQDMSQSLPPPPPPPSEPPPPPDTDVEEEEPELDQAPPQLSLAQLDMTLNAGMGDAGAMGFASFDPNFNALAEMRIFELSELDKHPVPISRSRPIYPYEMKRNGVRGNVKLVFVVDALGNTRDIRVESSTHRQFEEPAVDAVRNWRFDPGVKDAEAVATRVRQSLDFTIQ